MAKELNFYHELDGHKASEERTQWAKDNWKQYKYLDVLFKLGCYLTYRVIDGMCKDDDPTYNAILDLMEKKWSLLKGVLYIRWRISMFTVLFYKDILIKGDEFMEQVIDHYELEFAHHDIEKICKAFPSCIVNIARICFLFAYYHYLNGKELQAKKYVDIAWNSFRATMPNFTFHQNISKADEISHLAEVLKMIQFLCIRAKLLKDSQERRKPPFLPSHPKHRQFKDCVLKIEEVNKEKAIEWK